MSAMSQNSNSPHMQADDVPPPPYSETDIYSNSGRPRSPNTTTTTSPDTASRVSSSTGSSDVVYTPPLTPQTSLNTHAQDSRQQPLPTTQPGATLYFESRPPPAAAAAAAAATGLQRDVVVYSVKVQGTSSPDDLPYQNRWAARDVTSQDWATFVNFLLPDHTTRGNAAVIERKLRAEEASGDASRASGCRVQAEAQLKQVRENQPSTTRTKREIEATIQQWNDGFFGPRGMKLKLELDQETGALARRGPGCDGDTLVLDRNGIQSNRLTPCSNGISRARRGCSSGRRDGPGDGNAAGPSRQAGRPEESTSRDDFRRDMHHGRHGRRGRRSADGGRGRHSRRDEKQYNHSRSSSESSVSSVASSSSESSIGSLPSHGDIKDHRLPLYTERLRDWTSNPDQMRTKSDVRALRADVQSTRWMPEDARLGQSVDRTALEAQIRGLRAQWKSIKKAQRQTRRRERRAERREQRHRRRDMRRACKDYSTQGLLGPFGIMPVPSVPAVPPIPSATSGRGGRGASSFGAVRAPGAWPEDDGQEAGVAAPPPGTASTAKYEAAERIEAEVGKMVSRAADLGGGVERRALEKAIEALTDNLDTLRMEADEAYARELAASKARY